MPKKGDVDPNHLALTFLWLSSSCESLLLLRNIMTSLQSIASLWLHGESLLMIYIMIRIVYPTQPEAELIHTMYERSGVLLCTCIPGSSQLSFSAVASDLPTPDAERIRREIG